MVNLQQDLISVIVPIYKVEKYLERCINSILNQTYNNLEIILVDDGSPDNCGKICDFYQKKDPRIKVIHKLNGGLSDARNAGLNIASGQYLGFIDSDDYIAPDMYEYLYYLIKNTNADIGICNACIVSDFELPRYTDDNNPIVLHGNQIMYSMICDKLFTVNTWNKLYKSSLFDKIKFPVGRLYEDLATTYKLLDRADTVVVSKAKKYAYVQRNGSIMRQTGFRMKADKIDIVDEMWGFFYDKERYDYEKISAGLIRYLLNDIFKMIGSGNVNNNSEYRVRLKEFVRRKNQDIYNNHYISVYHKMLLWTYLFCPNILAFMYRIKGGDS